MDRLRLVESINLQIVHQVDDIERYRMAFRTTGFAEGQLLPFHLNRIMSELVRIELAVPT